MSKHAEESFNAAVSLGLVKPQDYSVFMLGYLLAKNPGRPMREAMDELAVVLQADGIKVPAHSTASIETPAQPEKKPNTTGKLKLWNGHASCCRKTGDPLWKGFRPHQGSDRIYAAASSRAELRRMIEAYCGRDPGDHEIKTYWNQGCWGNDMENITPEKGLWLIRQGDDARPVRLI